MDLGYKGTHEGILYESVEKTVNWDAFIDDPRTSDVVLYIGHNTTTALDKSKINIHWNTEVPGVWTSPRSASNYMRIEKLYDYILCQCNQTFHERSKQFEKKYIRVVLPYDYNHIAESSNVDLENMPNKDFDVYMCASTHRLNPDWVPTQWFRVMEKFNYAFCSYDTEGHFRTWEEKTNIGLRSKITIVFTGMINPPPPHHEKKIPFVKSTFPFIKFRTISEGSASHKFSPGIKHRVLDAAFSKSLILCHESPFADAEWPYHQTIEDYLDPDEDFIYFKNSQDLHEKITEISSDYDNQKYQDMIENAYRKVNEEM